MSSPFARRVSLCVVVLGLTTGVESRAAILAVGDVTPDPHITTLFDPLYVGKTADGALLVDGGSDVVSAYAYLGREAGATGWVTVDGPGSTWDYGGTLNVGYEGTGVLHITDGGRVSNHYTSANAYVGRSAGSTGVVKVGGADSVWSCSVLELGRLGDGSLTISDGGLVEASSSTSVGSGGGQGSIHFEGGTLSTGSLLAGATQLTGTGTIDAHGLVTDVDVRFDQNHALQQQVLLSSQPDQNIVINVDATPGVRYVWGAGYASVGSLTIEDGLVLESGNGYLGYLPGSSGTATVSGAGSTWNAGSGRAGFYVGHQGAGALHIAEGAQVNYGITSIGNAVGSAGVVTVDGTGSTLHTRSLTVGDSGDGELTITRGGLVDASQTMTLGYYSNGGGTVNLIDGTLRLHNRPLTKGKGTAMLNFTGGRLEGASTIALGAPLVQRGGILAPGSSVGTTAIEGGYTLDRGALEIEISGLGIAGVNWDLLEVDGPVDLVGANGLIDAMLKVILGFGPSLGDEFLVVDNDNTDPVIGAFATWSIVKAPYEDSLYGFLIDYTAGDGNDISLLAQSVGLWGDYNGDGAVDAVDYAVWQDTLGAHVAPFFGADGNGDGIVNEPDHSVWKAHFGGTADVPPPPPLLGGAVPEPSGLVLQALGALVAVALRRR